MKCAAAPLASLRGTAEAAVSTCAGSLRSLDGPKGPSPRGHSLPFGSLSLPFRLVVLYFHGDVADAAYYLVGGGFADWDYVNRGSVVVGTQD